MIPILYRPDELNFTSNGIGRLVESSECTVTEERNGIFELEFKYPITGRFYQYMIEEGGVVAVIHDDQKDIQPFDIYRYSAPIDGIVTFNAHHISYRLSNIIVKPFQADSAADALNGLRQNAVNNCPFTFWTDKAVSASYTLSHPDNIRALLAGQQGSILDVYGKGDYEFDRYEVKLYVNRGTNRGVTIRYGKNLADINRTKDHSGTFSAIAPYWTNGEETVLLPEVVVLGTNVPLARSPWTDSYGEPITDGNGEIIYFQYLDIVPAPMDFSSEFNEKPTAEELREKAIAYLDNNEPWLPSDNIDIDFVQLWQTPEYENVASLQRVSLCDTVSIYYPELGVTQAEAKVIKVVYNVLLERYDSMEIGDPKNTLSSVYTTAEDLSAALSNVPSLSFMAQAIQNATDLISGGLGGYVVMNHNADGQPQEILIMDTPDINTAVHVIRMNKNGIGFSNNGYEGPFESAWTIDGKFNADFIATGTLLANFIHGGTLTLGGVGDGNGVAVVYDENGNEITRIDSEGVTSKALVATDYVHVDGGTGSLIRIPLPSNTPGYIGSAEISAEHPLRVRQVFSIISGDDTVYRYAISEVNSSGAFMSYREDTPGTYTRLFDGEVWNGVETNSTSYGIWSYFNASTLYIRYNAAQSQQTRITYNSISTSGTKSRIAEADEFGQRYLYCYETPSPMFGDVGEGVIDETGVCYVFLDPVFAETITTNQYQVFLQRYGQGDCYVSERKPDYFVVSGEPGLSFGWELKAKQKDFDQLRLEKEDETEQEEETDYGNNGNSYYIHLQEGRIA